ncbi:MAG: hypothetical protein ACI9F9_003361, partial [Candidatus Paceibacteria bacterium]
MFAAVSIDDTRWLLPESRSLLELRQPEARAAVVKLLCDDPDEAKTVAVAGVRRRAAAAIRGSRVGSRVVEAATAVDTKRRTLIRVKRVESGT